MKDILLKYSILTFLLLSSACSSDDLGILQTEIIPLTIDHAHGSTIAELPNGDLLAAWFQGSGERWADDVQIMGARLTRGGDSWGQPFLMADVPDFPDINPVLFLDPEEQLWLVWYTVIPPPFPPTGSVATICKSPVRPNGNGSRYSLSSPGIKRSGECIPMTSL